MLSGCSKYFDYSDKDFTLCWAVPLTGLMTGQWYHLSEFTITK